MSEETPTPTETPAVPPVTEQISAGLEDDGIEASSPETGIESEVTPAAELPSSTIELSDDHSDANEEESDGDIEAGIPFDGTPRTNTEQRFTTTEKLKDGQKIDPDNAVQFITSSATEVQEALMQRPLSSLGATPQVAKWVSAIQGSEPHLLRGDALKSSVNREDSMWRQSVKSDSVELHAGRPKVGEQEGGEKLTGLAAKARIQSILGVGSPVRIPLWHTGIWVVLNTPSEGALLELDRRIGSEKVLLGRLTNGMIFSHSSVYTASYLANFALSQIHDATARFTDPAELKSLIKTTDIPSLIWGLMLSVYPNGYPYQEPCMKDPTKCNHVVEEMLNLGKIQWTDERALTDFQRKLMQRRNSKFTPEELQRYEEEHKYHQFKTVELHEKLSMDLRVPTLKDYEDQGMTWVDNMVRAVDRSASPDISNNDRNTYIMEQASTSALNQYGHWIERLTIKKDGKTEIIEDRDTIADTLSVLVSNEEISEKFLTGVGAFIDRTTISLIALPKYDCPACGEPMKEEYKAHPNLAPMDVMSTFFTIQTQHTSRVLSRSMM